MSSIRQDEVIKYDRETENDTDFIMFRKVHPDITQISPIWKVARALPHMKTKCFKVSKIICSPSDIDNYKLCEYCGKLYNNNALHYSVSCPITYDERETFWDIIINTMSIHVGVHLHTLADEELLETLLGGPCPVFSDAEDHLHFLVISINFLSKLTMIFDDL